MQIEGAVLREQGVTFAVVVVKRHVVDNRTEAQSAIRSFGSIFQGMPIVLMAQDSSGRPTYFGRTDLSRFMSHVSPSRVPWKRYTIN
jgi:hypothetical protein